MGTSHARRNVTLLSAAAVAAGALAVPALTAVPASAATIVTNQSFTAPGTYRLVIPPGTTQITVTGLGGAGLPGNASSIFASYGGRGGAGTMVAATYNLPAASVWAGDTLQITVGAKGGGGQGAPTAATAVPEATAAGSRTCTTGPTRPTCWSPPVAAEAAAAAAGGATSTGATAAPTATGRPAWATRQTFPPAAAGLWEATPPALAASSSPMGRLGKARRPARAQAAGAAGAAAPAAVRAAAVATTALARAAAVAGARALAARPAARSTSREDRQTTPATATW